MFLQNGTYIKTSDICHMSPVRIQHGDRRWNTNMTHEIVEPDTYYIDLKLTYHSLRLEYDVETAAQEEYRALQKAIQP